MEFLPSRFDLKIRCLLKWQWRKSFHTLHCMYLLIVTAIGTFILFLSPPSKSHDSQPHFTFINALYTSVSAVTTTGLMCVSTESLSQSNKVTLLILSILGSQMFTSYVPLYIRRLKYRRFVMAISNKQHEIGDVDAGNSCSVTCDDYYPRLLEYEALTLLSSMLVMYFLGIQFIGFVMIENFLQLQCREPANIVEGKGESVAFFASFSSIAAFSNWGLSLLDDNMVAFRKCPSVLLTHSALILLGNTMFAPCLRFIIWILFCISKVNSKNGSIDNNGTKLESTLGYLLRQPRSCYTHLFPQKDTMLLVGITIGLSSMQMLLLCWLQWGSTIVFGSEVSGLHKLVDAIFQSIATRNAGENVVNLPQLSPPLRLLYVALMYLSIYPIFLTRQHTNTLREKGDLDLRVSVQARKLLAQDSTYLFFALFMICIIESENISHDPLNFSIFNVVFETVSAYGNVGMSMGYDCKVVNVKEGWACKDVRYSLSGKWKQTSKLVLIILMLLGRQRGLPESMDSALQLSNIATSNQRHHLDLEGHNHVSNASTSTCSMQA